MRQLQIIDNSEVEVRNGIIYYVGKTRNNYRDGFYDGYQYFDAKGKCLLPGFVDSHTHFVFGGERAEEFSRRLNGESYMSIMNRGGGIAGTVKATRALAFNSMRSGAATFLERMSRMGVTTVEGKSGYGLNKETELMQKVKHSCYMSDDAQLWCASGWPNPEYEQAFRAACKEHGVKAWLNTSQQGLKCCCAGGAKLETAG